MDILAHTLWAGAGAKGLNAIAKNKDEEENKNSRVSVGWTEIFGVFPDLFAFSLPFIFRFYYVLSGDDPISVFFVRSRGGMGGAEDGFNISHILYQYSHSLVIWFVVFLIVWVIFKRPRYELLGWALHILIDIPSHVLAFYPTPFLFPISNYRFPYGIQWSNQWFMIINYSALLFVWGSFFIKNLLQKKSYKI